MNYYFLAYSDQIFDFNIIIDTISKSIPTVHCPVVTLLNKDINNLKSNLKNHFNDVKVYLGLHIQDNIVYLTDVVTTNPVYTDFMNNKVSEFIILNQDQVKLLFNKIS